MTRKTMTRKRFAVGALALLLVWPCCLTGCSVNKNANVQLDSSKTVHQKTPEQVQAIKDNPHIPDSVKAQMLGHSAGPPSGRPGP